MTDENSVPFATGFSFFDDGLPSVLSSGRLYAFLVTGKKIHNRLFISLSQITFLSTIEFRLWTGSSIDRFTYYSLNCRRSAFVGSGHPPHF
jgi:hypothetical protein